MTEATTNSITVSRNGISIPGTTSIQRVPMERSCRSTDHTTNRIKARWIMGAYVIPPNCNTSMGMELCGNERIRLWQNRPNEVTLGTISANTIEKRQPLMGRPKRLMTRGRPKILENMNASMWCEWVRHEKRTRKVT